MTVLAVGLAAALTSSAPAAQPSTVGPGTLPSTVPSAATPGVDDGRVFAIAQTGSTMVIGGSFSSVGGSGRQKVAAFDKSTGALSAGFAPTVNGDVNAVIPGPSAGTVYIGGAFTQVNGVATQFVALLNLSNGSLVSSFKAPAFNYGYVNDLVLRAGRLYVAGTFTTAGGKTHRGLVSLVPATGALDPFVTQSFTGHHNDSGSGAQAWVGVTDIDVTADGSRLVAIGNFKTVDGQLRDQVAQLDLGGASSALAGWSTTRYSPYCIKAAFDQYVRGVAYSPDGTYFAISATGGPSPGTLCDATARFETNGPAGAQPTWIAETGGDTLWGITVTGNAIYTGGHNRWANNPLGSDNARAGAVPRAALAALDPATGRPYAWNPGRIPLGVSAFAFLATADGLWVGSDQNYIGNYQYKRPKIAFFPYAGGAAPASSAVATLPGRVYLGARRYAGTTTPLAAVDFDGTRATARTVSGGSIDFTNWHGAFLTGGRVYYGYGDGYLYSRSFSNGTFGAAVRVDPYNDPKWANVTPYSGSPPLRGQVPTLYGQLGRVSGMTYYRGRMYYTLAGDPRLYSKWFLPDSGVLDETTTTQSSSVDLSAASGMFVSGANLYYATTDGSLRRVAFTGGNPSGAATVVSGPGVDGIAWSAQALFLAAQA